MIKNKQNTEKYTWGNNCSGWKFVDSPELSIIEEEMPPGTEEVFHFHKQANQFFYILEGTAVFILDNEEFEVGSNEGFHIEAGKIHKIKNKTLQLLKFVVISNPSTKGDRHEYKLQ